MAKPVLLTEDDRDTLQSMLDAFKRLNQPKLTASQDNQPAKANGGYVAKVPVGGIPAISGTTLGSASCDIYRKSSTSLISIGLQVTVNNSSSSAVSAGTYVPVVRDKFGDWFVSGGGGSVSVDDPIPVRTYSTMSSGYTRTSNTLTASTNTTLTIDGKVMAVGESFLQNRGTSHADNGLWTMTAAGVAGVSPWTADRHTLANTSALFNAGLLVRVYDGTTYHGTLWTLATIPSISLNTTATIFTQFAAGTASPLSAKGDVWGYSTVNARVPVGANGEVLTADSSQALGVKWAAQSVGVTSVYTDATHYDLWVNGSVLEVPDAWGANRTAPHDLAVRGVVNTVRQHFAGVKWFDSGLLSNGSVTAYALDTVGDPFNMEAITNTAVFGLEVSNDSDAAPNSAYLVVNSYDPVNGYFHQDTPLATILYNSTDSPDVDFMSIAFESKYQDPDNLSHRTTPTFYFLTGMIPTDCRLAIQTNTGPVYGVTGINGFGDHYTGGIVTYLGPFSSATLPIETGGYPA